MVLSSWSRYRILAYIAWRCEEIEPWIRTQRSFKYFRPFGLWWYVIGEKLCEGFLRLVDLSIDLWASRRGIVVRVGINNWIYGIRKRLNAKNDTLSG